MAKRTGLGRGIGALIPTMEPSEARPVDVFFPDGNVKGKDAPVETVGDQTSDSSLVTVPGARLVHIDPKSIVPNPRQPRTHFDADDLAELIHSVREFRSSAARCRAGQGRRHLRTHHG
ncbi:hypothetical protein QE418_001289 [Microbacterium testaceum]|nr:hypothetical protein [Microbacterium testaceum]